MAVEWTAEHIRTMKTSALLACLSDPANTFLADLNERMHKNAETPVVGPGSKPYDEVKRIHEELAEAMSERVVVVVQLINAEIDRRIPVPA